MPLFATISMGKSAGERKAYQPRIAWFGFFMRKKSQKGMGELDLTNVQDCIILRILSRMSISAHFFENLKDNKFLTLTRHYYLNFFFFLGGGGEKGGNFTQNCGF